MNLPALLAALAIIESGDAKHPQGNDLARGRKGEVSRYQIMPATWRAYGGGALSNARDPQRSRMVAVSIIESIHFHDWMTEQHAVMAVAIQWNSGPKSRLKIWAIIRSKDYKPHSYPMRVWREYQAILGKKPKG